MVLSFTSPLFPGPIRLSLRPGSSTLALGMNHVLWFDGAGRLITAYRDGACTNAALITASWPSGAPGRPGGPSSSGRILADEEKRRLVEEVQATIHRVLAALPADAPPAFRARFAQAVRWTLRPTPRITNVFSRPTSGTDFAPDQYLALVLQATEGCHYNRCTFCHFTMGDYCTY
jgi:hypothetical protein